MGGTPEVTWSVLFAVLAASTLCDLRTRRIPVWLFGGGIAAECSWRPGTCRRR